MGSCKFCAPLLHRDELGSAIGPHVGSRNRHPDPCARSAAPHPANVRQVPTGPGQRGRCRSNASQWKGAAPRASFRPSHSRSPTTAQHLQAAMAILTVLPPRERASDRNHRRERPLARLWVGKVRAVARGRLNHASRPMRAGRRYAGSTGWVKRRQSATSLSRSREATPRSTANATYTTRKAALTASYVASPSLTAETALEKTSQAGGARQAAKAATRRTIGTARSSVAALTWPLPGSRP